MGNLEATKNAFSPTSAAIAANLRNSTPGESHCGAIPSAATGADAINANKEKLMARMPRMLSGLHPAIPSILPARLRHARNEPGGSKFTKSETRNLEPANEGAAAAGYLAAIYHPRRAGIARQLRETGIIFLRFQLRPHRCVLLHRRALALVAIDPGGLGHKEVRNLSKDVRFANSIIGRGSSAKP